MRNVTKLLTLLLLAAWALPANAQFAADWQRTVANSNIPTFFGGTTERGFAYGMVGGNARVYVPSRNGGNSVRILNAVDGSDVGTLDLTGVSGGLFLINDAGVSDDGVIFVCNLTLDSSNPAHPFKCYTWTTEAAAPTNVLAFDAGFDSRFGDKITIDGSCSDNSAEIWAVDADGSLGVYRFMTADNCATFTLMAGYPVVVNNADAVPAGAITTVGSIPDVAPLAGGAFWLTGAGTGLRLFDATGDYEGEVSGGLVSTGSTSMKAFSAGGKDYVVSMSYGAGVCNLVDVTSGAGSATLVANTPTIGTNGTSGNADSDIRVDGAGNLTVYCMSANNGVARFTYSPALPVELTDFTATASGTSVSLAWATASETNNSGFAVEHFRSGAFAEVGNVTGAGTTIEAQVYGFTVDGLASGTHRFRLKQTDYDGAFSYSPEVEVEIGMADAYRFSEAYPNPASGTAMFSLSVKAAQTVEVAAYDLLGRKVATVFSGAVAEGTAQALTLDASDLPSGLYLLRATGETFSATQRLTVAR